MLKFVTSLKKKYRERRLHREEQWPPVRGDKLINLELVEADKTEGFRAGLPQHGASDSKIKRTPILHSDLFQTEDSKKPVRKLLIEGNGGMGKTALCRMLAEGWAEEEILTQFDCCVLLPLREKSVSSATTILQLFKLLHPSERIRTSVIEELEDREGDRLLIIVDGWDELDEANRSKDSFLYSLLFGDLLPFASVLLTSRPSASAPFHKNPSVDCLVEVIGFNEENVKQYIESEFEKCPEKASSLIEQLENNPFVLSVCSVPLNCAIVCNLWHTMNQVLPSTQTELYTLVVLNVIFRGIKKKFPDCKIGKFLDSFASIPNELQAMFWLTSKFAFECLSRDQIVFSEKELASLFPEGFDLNDKFLCFGLLQSAESLLPTGHGLSFHFLHLTFQEFLAALHLVRLPAEEQLQFCEAHAKSSRFAMVWRFAFGLGSKKQDSHGVSVSSKRVCLDNEVMNHFVPALTDMSYRLLLCHCALESQDNTVSIKVAETIRGQFESVGSIAHTAHDCVAVYHVLRHTSHCPNVRINLSGCGLTRELADILSIAGGQLNVTELRLDNNKLTDKFIVDLFDRASSAFSSLDKLYLDGNNINDVMTHFVLSDTSCKSLTALSLSDNTLGVSCIESLERTVQAGMLNRLEYLYLDNTLTDDADVNGALLATLAPSIASHCPYLHGLYLTRNNLGIPGACALGQAFPLLTTNKAAFVLHLIETNLNCEAVTAFSTSAISGLSPQASSFPSTPSCHCTLYLNDNPLGYDGLLAIFRMLGSETSQITRLYLDNTDLTSHESHTDTRNIKEFENNSLEWLSVNWTNFSGDGLCVLAKCIQVCHSLRHLNSNDCSLSSIDIINLLSLLKSSGTTCEHLERWYISRNSIDREGVLAIAEQLDSLFPSLRYVYLIDNPLSHDDKQRLEDCLVVRREAMEAKQEAEREAELEAGFAKLRAEWEARRSAVLTEWEKTCLPPQSEELLEEFYEMWDELLWEFQDYINQYTYVLEVSTKDEPAGDKQSTLEVSPPPTPSDEVSPPPTPSDDESFYSATEELDEYVEHCPTASDETTCPTVQSPHRIDQQETFSDPEVSSLSTSSNTAVEDTATASPQTLHSEVRTVTIAELIAHTGVTNSQLSSEIEDHDLYKISSYFDNIDAYVTGLRLNPSQQADVKLKTYLNGTQAGMYEALKMWRKPNPYLATYQRLVELVLDMGNGSVAVEVCKYCHQHVDLIEDQL